MLSRKTQGWPSSLLVAVLTAACSDSPTEPEENVAAGTHLDAALQEAERTMGAKRDRPIPSLLGALLHEAIHTTAREHGEEAARELTAALHQLREEAASAHEAGDVEALRRALEAIRVEAARIVVSVFGPGVVERVLHQVGTRLEGLFRRLAEAEAHGHDVSHAREVLSHLAELHGRSREALAAGEPIPALILGTVAAEILNRHFDHPRDHRRAGLLDRLLHEAIGRVAHSDGEDQAKALLAGLEELHQAARRAREEGDEEALHRIHEAIQAEKAGIVVRIFGPELVERVIGHVGERLAQLRRRLENAATDHDVSRLLERVAHAEELLGRALAALEAGQPVPALVMAAAAADVLEGL